MSSCHHTSSYNCSLVHLMQCMNAATTWWIEKFFGYRSLSAASTFQSTLKWLVALFPGVWGIKIHFWYHKHYQNCWWESVLMKLFLCCVMSADASVHDDFFGQLNHMHCQLQRQKRGRVMLSLPAKRMCEYMLLTWHIFVYILMSHICFVLELLSLHLIEKTSPSSPASGTLTAIWFYCHSLLGAVTVCNLWLNLLMSSSQSFSVINWACLWMLMSARMQSGMARTINI